MLPINDHSPARIRFAVLLISALWLHLSAKPLYFEKIPLPQPLPDSAVEAILLSIKMRSNSPCELPGSIPLYKGDSCYNPVFQYCTFDTTADTAYSCRDTAKTRNLQIALYTFHKFSTIEKGYKKQFRFSHQRYLLQLTTKQKEEKKTSWLMRKIGHLLRLLNIHILIPLQKALVTPLQKLLWGWKVLALALGIAGFILFIYVFAKSIHRFYPVLDYRSNPFSDASVSLNYDHKHWLSKAQQFYRGGDYKSSIDCLYKWLIEHFAGFKGVQRQEWWTNHQFLELVKNRFPDNYQLANAIIRYYERSIYGHKFVEETTVHELLQSSTKTSTGI